MKHEQATYQTKSMIATDLRDMMDHKTLSKITVCELCKSCRINRKTFYYHFKDIYDVVEWMFLEELNNRDKSKSYEEAISFAIRYACDNRMICRRLLEDPVGERMVKRYLEKEITEEINSIMQSQNETQTRFAKNDFQDFLISYFGNGFVTYILTLIKSDQIEEDEINNSVKCLTVIMNESMKLSNALTIRSI